MVDALHSLNTKHSDFNKILVKLLSDEPNFQVVSMFLEHKFDAILNICSTFDVQNLFYF